MTLTNLLPATQVAERVGGGRVIECFCETRLQLEGEAQLYGKLERFWTAPPLPPPPVSVAAVAAPSLISDFCDGAEVIAPQ